MLVTFVRSGGRLEKRNRFVEWQATGRFTQGLPNGFNHGSSLKNMLKCSHCREIQLLGGVSAMATYYFPLSGNDDPNTLAAYMYSVPSPIDPVVFDDYISNQVYGLGGDDTITTTLGTSQVWLYGGDGNDAVTGDGGADFLYGDSFDGMTQQATGTGKDTVHGAGGADSIYGAGGNDKLYGDEDNDVIFGGGGKDRMFGGAGLDTLFGRSGDDILVGGPDADTFMIILRDGRDVIRDFEPEGIGHDVIGLSGIDAVTSFRDLIKNHAEAHKGDVILSLGAGTELVIEDTRIGDLIKADFMFLHL
jgi:Ca2+-binding RTX toxin-like protein